MTWSSGCKTAGKILASRLRAALLSQTGAVLVVALGLLTVASVVRAVLDAAALASQPRSDCMLGSETIGGAGRLGRRFCPEPIDAVYTWVNGSDPVWLREMQRYRMAADGAAVPGLGGAEGGALRRNASAAAAATAAATAATAAVEDPASQNRFRDNDELRYSLRSLVKYAPWIRRVHLVTDGQVPVWLNLEDPLVRVVSHEEIFADPSVLPVFSSPAIETSLHRIPGLSDRFVYFNDDVFLGADVAPSDFYTATGGQKVYVSWDVPKCAAGCIDTWVGDGYCDTACNVTRCMFDGGDCTGPDIRPGVGMPHQGFTGSSSGSSSSSSRAVFYCTQSCPINWLADKACDARCEVPECAWDAGDCGLERIVETVPGVAVTADVVAGLSQGLAVPPAFRDGGVAENATAPAPAPGSEDAPLTMEVPGGVRIVLPSPGQWSGYVNVSALRRGLQCVADAAHWAEGNATRAEAPAPETASWAGVHRCVEQAEQVGSAASLPTHRWEGAAMEETPWLRDAILTEHAEMLFVFVEHAAVPHASNGSVVSLAGRDCNRVGTARVELRASSGSVHAVFSMNVTVGIAVEEASANSSNATAGGAAGLAAPPVPPLVQRITEAQPVVSPVPPPEMATRRKLLMQLRPTQPLVAARVAQGPRRRRASAEPSHWALAWRQAHGDVATLRAHADGESLAQALVQVALGELRASGSALARPAGRRLLDVYADSLVTTNNMISRFFRRRTRKVPAHMPHFIDRRVAAAMTGAFHEEFDATARRRFRSPEDVQFAFAYLHWVIEGGGRAGLDMEGYWRRELDTDGDGELSANELRTLVAVVRGRPPTAADIEHVAECMRGADGTPGTRLTFARLLACGEVVEGLQARARTARTHEDGVMTEVAFEMITDDFNKTLEQLDSIRARKPKFICINDDMDEAPLPLQRILHDFFVAYFPAPSRFELPPGEANPYLRLDDLRAALRWRWAVRWGLGALVVALAGIWLSAVVRARAGHSKRSGEGEGAADGQVASGAGSAGPARRRARAG